MLLIARQVHSIQNAAVRARLSPEDLYQEAAGTMLRKLADFEYRGPGSLYGWMKAIAVHAVTDAIDHWEAAKRLAGRERALEAVGTETGTDSGWRGPAWQGAGPSTMAHRREMSDRLSHAITSLDERPYRIVTLRYFFGASWSDIAHEVRSPSSDAVRKEAAAVLVRLGAGLKA
jgi:RNA polymerase sigma factor (sigma-70 family)